MACPKRNAVIAHVSEQGKNLISCSFTNCTILATQILHALLYKYQGQRTSGTRNLMSCFQSSIHFLFFLFSLETLLDIGYWIRFWKATLLVFGWIIKEKMDEIRNIDAPIID